MEQENFLDDIDPQQMKSWGRTLSCLVDEIFSPFRILSPTHLCPLSSSVKKGKERRILKADRDLNFHQIHS